MTYCLVEKLASIREQRSFETPHWQRRAEHSASVNFAHEFYSSIFFPMVRVDSICFILMQARKDFSRSSLKCGISLKTEFQTKGTTLLWIASLHHIAISNVSPCAKYLRHAANNTSEMYGISRRCRLNGCSQKQLGQNIYILCTLLRRE